jgi:dipeptide/tripeptide permease
MNFANNMMGAVAPIVTGIIVGNTHSFTNAFLIAGFMLLLGVLSFLFLLGRIEPIAEPPHGRHSLSKALIGRRFANDPPAGRFAVKP